MDESGFYTELDAGGREMEVYGCPECGVSQMADAVRSLGGCRYCDHELEDDDGA